MRECDRDPGYDRNNDQDCEIDKKIKIKDGDRD
jgi:hypothetical protein